MKVFLNIFFIIAIVGSSSAQIIEIGTNYSSGNADFYKNVPGLNIGYVHDSKKQFLFSWFTYSHKNNSYTEIAPDPVHGSGYIMRKVEGKLNVFSVELGLMQKLKNSNQTCIAIGCFTSLNYFYFDDEIHYFDYVNNTIGYDYLKSHKYSEKNKIGIGLCLDFELKQILFDNLSCFSRIKGEIIPYDGPVKGVPFVNERIYSMRFEIGIKINLAAPPNCNGIQPEIPDKPKHKKP